MGIVRIIDNSMNCSCDFANIEIGETFKYDGELWIKFANNEEDDLYNALNLVTKNIRYFISHTEVMIVDVEIKILGNHRIGN